MKQNIKFWSKRIGSAVPIAGDFLKDEHSSKKTAAKHALEHFLSISVGAVFMFLFPPLVLRNMSHNAANTDQSKSNIIMLVGMYIGHFFGSLIYRLGEGIIIKCNDKSPREEATASPSLHYGL